MSSKKPPELRGVDRATAIAQILQDNIMGGHYSPGDRLPSEADLCTHFEVSRPTLREALGRLTARGLLTARRGAGGGAFVTRPDEASACDQISALLSLTTRLPENAHLPLLTEARLQLTYGCAELALLRASDISDLRAEIDVQSDFSIPDEDFIGSVRRMHLALAQASGNPALTILAQALIEAEFASTPTEGYPTRVRARFLSYHVRIANGIAGGRSDDIRTAITELWSFEQGRASEADDSGAAQVERPPTMRELRLPPVQRLKPLTPAPDSGAA